MTAMSTISKRTANGYITIEKAVSKPPKIGTMENSSKNQKALTAKPLNQNLKQ